MMLAAAALAVCGWASVGLGQDTNWDLRNYHRYNPWAWSGDRLDLDLAPGGAPSYLNPALEFPYAWMAEHWRPRVVAFAMGVVHGLDLLLLYLLARRVLPVRCTRLVAGVLALVAIADTTFLSEFGNSMGDDTTAVPMLAALALLIGATGDGARARVRWFASGCAAGIATGLKLTNGPCTLGLIVAAWVVQGGASRSVRMTAVGATAAGVAVGVAASYGFWFATLWQHFGNPFFPQFNVLFGSPLAAASHDIEGRWLPKTVTEAALFPFVFSLWPMRINEAPLVNPLWPIGYVALVALGLVSAYRKLAGVRGDAIDPRHAALHAFVGVGYLGWMTLFSVGRYAVVIELLLPLVVATALPRLLGRAAAIPLVAASLAIAALFPLLRFDTWGNAPFTDEMFHVDVPTIDDPAHTTVLIPGSPMSWMLPAFPPAVAFIGMETRFPESDGYLARVRATITHRAGPVFALLPAEANEEGSGRWRLNRWLGAIGSRRDDWSCRYAIAIVAHAPASDLLFADGPDNPDHVCRFDRDPARHGSLMHDAEASRQALARRAFDLDLAACTTHHASIGAQTLDYRYCPVR